jgi:metal-responsive CopG/Arc/MetJ family transcriptional regulator
MKEIGDSESLDNRHTLIHTNGMKIAISIPTSVFQGVKKAAEEQKRSRSEVIVEAVKAYLKDQESRRLMDALNKAYSSPETEEERETREAALDLYRRTVLEREEEW